MPPTRLLLRFLPLLVCCWLCGSGAAHAAPVLPAFPGAEGFGAASIGGRGGQVLLVTNLEDYDPSTEAPIPGSLRAAVHTPGPRIVIFKVSGTIALKAPLFVRHSYLTLAGESAPGDGICLKDHSLKIAPIDREPISDIIIRHLRLRPGDNRRSLDDTSAPVRGDQIDNDNDGLGIHNAKRVIIDHCSISWGVDEVLDIGASQDVSIQWSFLSEGLRNSTHVKGQHSRGVMIAYGADRISLHHNLIAHAVDRMPYFQAEGDQPFTIDFVNNVVYNWQAHTGVSYPKTNDNGKLNFVGNTYRMGPNSWEVPSLMLGVDTRVYAKDNFGPMRSRSDQEEYAGIRWGWQELKPRPDLMATERFPAPMVRTLPAADNFIQVLDQGGAAQPRRDGADHRLVDEVRMRKGQIIDHPSQVGGWPKLRFSVAPLDSDLDGMPDAWESDNGLNPADSSDSMKDSDSNGYTNIEEWLHSLRPSSRIGVLTSEPLEPDDQGVVSIPLITDTVVLDARLEEWRAIPLLPSVSFNPAKPSEGSFRMAWSPSGIFGAVIVKDERLHILPSDPYWGDTLELFIDPLNELAPSPDELMNGAQIMLMPAASFQEGEAESWISPWAGPRFAKHLIKAQWLRTKNGYVVEFFIPFNTLGEKPLEIGRILGWQILHRDDKRMVSSFPKVIRGRIMRSDSWGRIKLAMPVSM